LLITNTLEAMHPLAPPLLDWYEKSKRDLPWRNTTSPYKIWLSEVMLQQTRVEQGMPYYLKFTEKYKTVSDLAIASEDEILRMWQGLGYYSRARNLHKCAIKVHNELKGVFPNDYQTLLSLPGIGPYTAAAIASIAGGHPTPVVDGNVYRVTTRYFGIYNDIAEPATNKKIVKILEAIIPKEAPGDFNQAIMELGATVCSPKSPDCPSCPWKYDCHARSNASVDQLPVKNRKTKVRNRNLHYFVQEAGGKFHLKKRSTNDIWGGMYDFPVLEAEANAPKGELERLYSAHFDEDAQVQESSAIYSHKLSHQNINATFHRISSIGNERVKKQWFSAEEIEELPKSVLLQKYLNDHSI